MSPNPTELNAYLDRIGTTEITKSKIREAINFYTASRLLKIDECFAGQSLDGDGNVRVTTFWMFSGNLWAEADVSNGKVAGDVAVVGGRIARYYISATDTNFDDPNIEKSLKIDINVSTELTCELVAYGINRGELWKVFCKYVKVDPAG